MKYLITLLLLFITCFHSQAQSTGKTTHLIVRIDESMYDNLLQKKFVRIIAEGGNSYANEIYSLRFFDPSKKAVNGDYQYYNNQKDTVASSLLYNYFDNATQALNFITTKGWELMSVVPEISSSYTNERDSNGVLTPVTMVMSRNVYYFKKTIPLK